MMNIEDIRMVVQMELGHQQRLQVKVDGKWRDVRFVDSNTLRVDDDGVRQERWDLEWDEQGKCKNGCLQKNGHDDGCEYATLANR